MAPILGMHMANELLSVPVAITMLALAAAAVSWATARAAKAADVEKLPLMGVMGAFVFAAQMINFPVLPGTSDHLVGGVLLAILLGPWAALVTMAAILIIQCLLFQDGGLLALGANIINMGGMAVIGWLLYRLILGRPAPARAWRQYLAAWAACLVAVALGATLVSLEAFTSGVLQIPLKDFVAVMVGVHLISGFAEGLITFAVLAFLRRVRPAALGLPVGQFASPGTPQRLSRKAFAASVLATSLLLAAVVSWFASTRPDGLEWSYRDHRYAGSAAAIRNDSPLVALANAWQDKWTVMRDYSRREAPLGQLPPAANKTAAWKASWPNIDGWGSLAGLLGTAATLGVLYVLARWARRRDDARAAPNETG